MTGSVWPEPKSEKRSSTLLSAIGQQSSVLSEAMVRYNPLVFPDKKVPVEKAMKMVETLQIKILNAYEPLVMEPGDISIDFSLNLVFDFPVC